MLVLFCCRIIEETLVVLASPANGIETLAQFWNADADDIEWPSSARRKAGKKAMLRAACGHIKGLNKAAKDAREAAKKRESGRL